MKRMIFAAFCTSFAMLSPSYGEIVATQSVEKEIVERDDKGVSHVRRVKADTVTPGDEVIYTLHYENQSNEPASDIVLVMPVPDEVSYVEGSVFSNPASVTFSADGGQTYVVRGRLTIEDSGQPRIAKNDEITHIKWALSEPLPANAKEEISFRAILK